MIDAVLHPATKRDIETFLMAPTHAVALVGPAGIGKGFVAQQIARTLLGCNRQELTSHPFFLHVSPTNQTIGIGGAREIATFLKLKTTGTSVVRRLVIIEHADTLTLEAQNALLKSIEEPPADTVILLTLRAKTGVLPTILSRLQTINLRTPLAEDLKKYLLSQDFPESSIDKTFVLCDGLPGLAVALLHGDATDGFVNAIDTAKQLLTNDAFTRLTIVDEIAAKKQTEQVISALQYIAQAALVTASNRIGADSALKKWTAIATHTNVALEQLKSNAQAKLVLTNLCLHI